MPKGALQHCAALASQKHRTLPTLLFTCISLSPNQLTQVSGVRRSGSGELIQDMHPAIDSTSGAIEDPIWISGDFEVITTDRMLFRVDSHLLLGAR